MLVIVGHGPGVLNRALGPWLDGQTVVRLKAAERPTVIDWGTRTDFVCAGSSSWFTDRRRADFPDSECWVLSEKPTPAGPWRVASQDWLTRWAGFRTEKSRKPSTGLKAVFCALEFLKPAEIGLLGFDRVLHPEVPTSKWFEPLGKYSYAHDARAEHRCLMSLGVKITEV